MTATRKRAPRLWSRSRAFWGGVLQLVFFLSLLLALLVASSQGKEDVSSLLRGPTNKLMNNHDREAHRFTSALVANHAGTENPNRRLADTTTTSSTIDEATNKAKEIGASLLYQKTFTTGVDDTFNKTWSTLSDTNAWLVRIRTPLENIRDKVTDMADKTALQLGDTSFIDHGIRGLTESLADFEAGSANRALPTGCMAKETDPYCVPCSVCSSISSQVDTARQQIMDNARSGVYALKSVSDMLKWRLVEDKDPLRAWVAMRMGVINTFISAVNDTRATVDGWYDVYDDYKALQEAGVLVLFALALLAVVLGFIGVLFGLTSLMVLANLIHVAYVIGFLALLVSAILLAISVLFGDALDGGGGGKVGEIANACFQHQSVIDVLELAPVLDFARSGIQLPENIGVSKMLDFSNFGAFATTIQDADSSTFQVDQKSLDGDMDTLNTFTKQSDAQCNPNDGNCAEDNILTPWNANGGMHWTTDDGLTYMVERYRTYESSCPATGSPGLPFTCDSTTDSPCTFPAFIGETYKKASTLAAVKADAAAFVTELHQNMAKVMTDTSTFKVKTMELNDRVNMIKDDLESSLFTYVDDFEKEQSCTFVIDGYLAICNSLCGDVMPSLTMISLLLFLAGIFLIPVNICLIIAVKRLQARGNYSRVGPGDEVQVK